MIKILFDITNLLNRHDKKILIIPTIAIKITTNIDNQKLCVVLSWLCFAVSIGVKLEGGER